MWLWVKMILDSKVTNHLQMHWYPNDLTHSYQSDALPSHKFVYFNHLTMVYSIHREFNVNLVVSTNLARYKAPLFYVSWCHGREWDDP